MNEELILIVTWLVYLLSWVVVHILTDTKYLWCKRNCEKCGCWNCKYYHDLRKKRMKEQKWNDDKKQTIIFILAFIVALIWICYVITHPVTYTELPLEKRIMYERMIFP